ncbi:hypothetical protein MIND_00300300 [Mycena indigotica]|uniref:Uncharacterized protein n=1 Tax=Mycena indigotica TaxID=2126181 RepID=A0A8H6T1T8_9AGAR|nr:uncharacterized protein MIND_00300300 [Mycena indigotica]KAF7309300.1 hypothetical protein MIND_00300300 [Mycena indigotica]
MSRFWQHGSDTGPGPHISIAGGNGGIGGGGKLGGNGGLGKGPLYDPRVLKDFFRSDIKGGYGGAGGAGSDRGGDGGTGEAPRMFRQRLLNVLPDKLDDLPHAELEDFCKEYRLSKALAHILEEGGYATAASQAMWQR